LRIGSDFNVSWDGILTCNKLNTLNDDGRSDYAISINDNFYVTKGGSTGGGSASFGSGNFGSVIGGSGGFGGLKCDTLTVGGETYSKQRATFVTDLSLTRSGKNIQYRYTKEHLYVLATAP
jgi:hypothetical protein